MAAKLKNHTAAILTIHNPGKMSRRGRKDILKWLRRAADHFEQHGENYTLGRFRARFIY